MQAPHGGYTSHAAPSAIGREESKRRLSSSWRHPPTTEAPQVRSAQDMRDTDHQMKWLKKKKPKQGKKGSGTCARGARAHNNNHDYNSFNTRYNNMVTRQ